MTCYMSVCKGANELVCIAAPPAPPCMERSSRPPSAPPAGGVPGAAKVPRAVASEEAIMSTEILRVRMRVRVRAIARRRGTGQDAGR